MSVTNSEPLLLQCSPNAFLAGTIKNALSGYATPLDAFPSEYFELKITIKGEKFHSSINGELAKSLWEFEKSLRRAYAQMLHGTENINSLTAEERNECALNFKVTEGSSKLTASLKELSKSFGKGFQVMGDVGKSVVIALIISGLLGYYWLEGLHEEKMKELEVKGDMASQENLLKAISYVRPFQYAMKESSDRLAKSVPDAESVSINEVTYSKEDIQKLRERAPRTKAEAELITQVFVIFGIERVEEGSLYKVKLKYVDSNQSTTAILSSEKGLFSSLNVDANAEIIGKYIEEKKQVTATLLIRTTKSNQEIFIIGLDPM